MLEVKINGESHQMKNSAKEFTIREYEDLCEVLNNDRIDEIDKYYRAFVMLGLDGNVLDTFDGFAFLTLIKEFKDVEMEIGDLTQSIELNGRTYTSFRDNEFYFSVKDMKEIEKYVKLNPIRYIGEIMAIIFKDEELTKAEHYSDAHIKHKANMIREVITYDIAIPFINSFSTQLVQSLEAYKND